MPTVTKSLAQFSLTSERKATYNTSPTKEWVIDLSSIMQGSTINTATMSLFTDGNGSWEMRLNSGSYVSINNVRDSAYNVNIKNLFKGKTSFSNDDQITFKFTGYSSTTGRTDTGSLHGNPSGNITLSITYTLPYTACGAPTSVTAASTNVAPGATVRVSWSGATAGTNNPIASYTVYRSTDNLSWSKLQSGITNTYLDVTAPTTNGAIYYYKVVTVGTVSGYNSAKSSATAQVKCVFTAPSVSAVKLDDGTTTVYKLAGATATLTWTGTNGTNNAITKYQVKQGSTLLGEPTSATFNVTAPSAGSQASYTIIPIGTYSNGSGQTSPTLAAYSGTTAPSTVGLAKSTAGKSETVRLSWSGAEAGTSNAISGYSVYRATTVDGEYSILNSVETTETSGYLDVVSSSENDGYYYYKVVTVGAHSTSSMSSAVSLHTVWTAPTTSSISLSNTIVAPGTTSTLNFTCVPGTNNPIASIEVYQGDTKIATLLATATSYTVTAGSNAGDQLTFKVKPIGTETTPASVLSSGATLKSYGNVTAPTSVSVSNSTPDAGSTTTLSWSGAQNGSFNSIISYTVYRSNNISSGYSVLQSNITGTSLSVEAPSNMGSSYYYKVVTKGEKNQSDLSAAYAIVTAKIYSAPGAPSATVDPAVAGVDDNPVLTWTTAADGTNNPVTGYRVFRSTSASGTYTQLGADISASVHSISLEKPATMGASYYYRVYALAAKAGFSISQSSNTVSLTAQTYGNCGIPRNVTISATILNPNATVTISWQASSNGSNNPVAGYRVIKSTGGGFTSFAEVGSSTYSVTDTVGASGVVQMYRVIAIATIQGFDSGESNSVAVTSNSPPNDIGVLTEATRKIYASQPISLRFQTPVDVNNNLSYYEVEMRFRRGIVYSEWESVGNYPVADYSADGWTNLLVSPDAGSRGAIFQLRIRAVDTLGLTSSWERTSTYTKNIAPPNPTILIPVNDAIAYSAQPYIVVRFGANSLKNSQTVQMKIDNDDWHNMTSLGSAETTRSIRLYGPLSVGVLHIITIKVVDEYGDESQEVSVYIRRSTIEWTRTIQQGTIISRAGSQFQDDVLIVLDGSFSDDVVTVNNGTWSDDRLIISGEGGISHQAEIVQMYNYVNAVCNYYGIAQLVVPEIVGEDYGNAGEGKIGMFAAWGSQMLELYNKLKDIDAYLQVTAPVVTISVGMIPTANVINTLRTMIESM